MTGGTAEPSLADMNEPSTSRKPHVVIAGGGVAGLEALMALRALAGDRLHLTLLAPEPDFVYRPMAVAEPFCLGHTEYYPLADIARDYGADLVRDALAEVDPAARRITGREGASLAYDSLLVAIGARPEAVYRHAITFGTERAPEALAGLLGDLEQGYLKRVAFVIPSTLAWTMPLYELAVLTAREVWGMGIDDAELTFVTPEERPLEIFGPEPSAMVADLLEEHRIPFVGGVEAVVERSAVIAGGRRIEVDRTITLPMPAGPRIPGLPADTDGFLPVDPHGRVWGVHDVYAAGDVTSSTVKQGGLAAQQAVAAAETIAARHGADVAAEPFRPVLRGMLLTGGTPRFLSGPHGATPAVSRGALQALWWPPTKIATRYLAPYLVGHDAAANLGQPPAGAHPVEREIELAPTPDGSAGR
jgi:sulfide:quinone oxidoreductase